MMLALLYVLVVNRHIVRLKWTTHMKSACGRQEAQGIEFDWKFWPRRHSFHLKIVYYFLRYSI